MKPQLIGWKSVILLIVAQAGLVFSEASVNAQQDTIPLLTALELSGVRLVVNASPKHQKAFSRLAIDEFKRAGIVISLKGNEALARQASELMLSVRPKPIEDICPGKVLYAPSLTLNEDLIVSRPGEDITIKGSSWSSFTPPHLRQPLTIQELEEEISELTERFAEHYRLVSSSKSSRVRSTGEEYAEKERRAEPPTMWVDGRISESPLKNLDIRLVNFSLWAGASTQHLHDRAIEFASKEGVKLTPLKMKDAPMLSVKLEYQRFNKECTGKGMYSATLELVERVRVRRLSDVYIWASTWSREKTRVSGPPSKVQMQKDSEELLAQFITAYKADNGTH